MENQEKEVWKDVVGFETLYSISNKGNVIRKSTGHKLRHFSRGPNAVYDSVQLTVNNIKKHYCLHILLARAFIPNDDPEHKIEVDHIDRNTKNNSLENLRWVSKSGNCQNRNNELLAKNFDGKRIVIPVIRTDKNNNKKYFHSITEAVDSLNPIDSHDRHTKHVNISACLYGRQKTCCGYRWEKA